MSKEENYKEDNKMKKIHLVLLIALFTRMIYFIFPTNLWWDAAVYFSMAKYIASMRTLGLWEPIRPLLWPLLLSPFSYLTQLISALFSINISLEIFGYILTTLFSLGIIYLTFKIAKKLYGEKIALISSIIISFTWILFFFNARLYTEIPATFLSLLALYYFINESYYKTGFFTALAFLTKFPCGLLLPIFLILKPKQYYKTLILFLLTVTPYLILNYYLYNSPIQIFLIASETLKHAGIWIFQQPWYFYLKKITLQNTLYIAAIPGIIIAIKRKHYVLAIIPLAFFLYFTQMLHKETRFLILFLPYLSILASSALVGLTAILKKIKFKYLLYIVIIITTIFFAFNFQIEEHEWNPYYTYLENKSIEGELLITHPNVGYYANSSSSLLYYSWFNFTQADYWVNYIKETPPGYIAIDTCGGGIICHPEEPECEIAREQLLQYINETYSLEYYDKRADCEYFIYHNE